MLQDENYNSIGIREKLWGYETLVVSNELYCAKYLTFSKAGNKFSMHYHAKKDETWVVVRGSFTLSVINTEIGSVDTTSLEKGESVRIYPKTIHQLEALEDDSCILEVSTMDDPDDNYRVWPGVAV